MTFAPQKLKDLAAFWQGQGGVHLGIVGDQAHGTVGVSYHLGKSQLIPTAYSIQLPRDKAGLTEAASAIDLGKLNGSLLTLRTFSRWLVARCLSDRVARFDVREIIYSPDGVNVQRYSGVSNAIFTGAGNGDSSHRTHTHISFYRDSEKRDKIALFRPFWLPDTAAEDAMVTFDMPDSVSTATVTRVGADPAQRYMRLKDGTLHPFTEIIFPKRAVGPVVLPTGTILGDALERRTGWVIGQEAAFLLDVDVKVTQDHEHRRSTDP